jgi:hypothetical protein
MCSIHGSIAAVAAAHAQVIPAQTACRFQARPIKMTLNYAMPARTLSQPRQFCERTFCEITFNKKLL